MKSALQATGPPAPGAGAAVHGEVQAAAIKSEATGKAMRRGVIGRQDLIAEAEGPLARAAPVKRRLVAQFDAAPPPRSGAIFLQQHRGARNLRVEAVRRL